MLEIKGLTKYFGGLGAIVEVDLNIYRGELIGLIGPNGAGKTTLFNLITGFIRPDAGKILYEGKDIAGQRPHSIAELGIVRTFQATRLFDYYSVLQNVIVACHLRPKFRFWEEVLHTTKSRANKKTILSQAIEILHFVGLENAKDTAVNSLPHGLKRILGIAIAMAVQPKLLLLDEPLSGMSAEEVSNAMKLIRKILEKGVTILLIEHNMKAAMSLCERMAVLNFGRKIAEGSPEELKKNPDVIHAYLGAVKHAT